MKRRTRTESEKAQADFLLSGVGLFLDHSDLSEMTVQNDYGVIVVKRASASGDPAFAVGFSAELNEGENEDGEDESDGLNDLTTRCRKWTL